ncbi:MAG: SET domain-containing protein [Patescibacteria group bacterium]
MTAKLFEIRETKDKGSGLFAITFIPAGTIVCFECDTCKKRTEEDIKKLPKKKLEWVLDHEYKDKTGLFSDVCDKTILVLNHSCNANILFCDKGFDIVVRDIQKGEEATYDYRVFFDNLNMPCHCGEKNCCKIVTCKHPIPKTLKLFWLKKIHSALKLINIVEQPLIKVLKQQSIDL